jgi:hypothetical protein
VVGLTSTHLRIRLIKLSSYFSEFSIQTPNNLDPKSTSQRERNGKKKPYMYNDIGRN